MSGSVGSDVKAEPNLTPILDMVFQLITFFVLIFNCKQAEIAANVVLPVVGSARPVDKPPAEHVIVLNFKFEDTSKGERPPRGAQRKPQFWCMGRLIPEDQIRSFAATEARSSRMAQNLTEQDITDGKELSDIIMIRSDKEIPFRLVNNVIFACQEQGYRHFAFSARQKEE